jgi:protein O-GlcNAc transferase
LVFARKPAPIQVTYIGYQNTTGMQAMDYRLTDDYSDPPGQTDHWHTERLARLPVTFFCYQPSSNAPPVNPPPSEANGYVTFGSMNNFTKVTPQVLAAWAELMRRVSGSRMLIRADMTPWLQKHLVEVFAGHGIGEERLILRNRAPRPEYLEMIRGFDIALDPFPFNGHTTTCDCLWQGVPVVTLSGDTYVSRFGGSGLVNMGLEDLIAHSVEEYVDIATRLALDADRRHQLRFSLRERMAVSPLLDFAGFARNLETEYRRMWHRFCAEHPA